MIDQNSDGSAAALYYIETDFTNTPRFLRRAAGDLTKPVWSWPMAPYGDTPANTTTPSPACTTTTPATSRPAPAATCNPT